MAYENRSNIVDAYVRLLRDKVDRPFGDGEHRDGSRARVPDRRREHPACGSRPRSWRPPSVALLLVGFVVHAGCATA